MPALTREGLNATAAEEPPGRRIGADNEAAYSSPAGPNLKDVPAVSSWTAAVPKFSSTSEKECIWPCDTDVVERLPAA
jgi:hypothetical protein